MTYGPSLSKEIRALLPMWLACTTAVVAAGALGNRSLYAVGVLVYGLGSVALGAQSIGHEYTCRTLGLILSQPSSRRRIVLVKLGVLMPMLLAFGAVAWVALVNPRVFHFGFGRFRAPDWWGVLVLFLLPVLCGLFVAPLLTMLSRSPLGGIVFTVLVPALLWFSSEALAVAMYGLATTSRPEGFTVAVFWWGMLGVCAVAVVLNWRMFMRLEAIEGRDPDVRLPAWPLRKTATRAATPVALPRNRHPVWLLVKKELHLQQMSYVVAGLYGLAWVTVSVLRRIVPEFFEPPFGAITIIYGGLVALLIGSLASAEERQFGTLEWQVLLPMATWKQWGVKAGTALSLVMLLALGLPVLLTYIHPSTDALGFNLLAYAGAIILLTTGSLYVSSFCTSGLWAMMLSIPMTLVVFVLPGWLLSIFLPTLRQFAPSSGRASSWVNLLGWLVPCVVLAAFLAPLMRFGLVNHRSAEHGLRRVWKQAFIMFGCLTFGASVLAVAATFF